MLCRLLLDRLSTEAFVSLHYGGALRCACRKSVGAQIRVTGQRVPLADPGDCGFMALRSQRSAHAATRVCGSVERDGRRWQRCPRGRCTQLVNTQLDGTARHLVRTGTIPDECIRSGVLHAPHVSPGSGRQAKRSNQALLSSIVRRVRAMQAGSQPRRARTTARSRKYEH